MVSGPQPIPRGEIERRKEYLAPLWAHLAAGCYSRAEVMEKVRVLAEQAGDLVAGTRQRWLWRVAQMRRGFSLTPPWFIERCCTAIDTSVMEVMGAEWARRFGVDGRGGVERAPVRAPRRQQPWSKDPQREGVDNAA